MLNNRVTKIAFLVSLSAHLLFLCVLGRSFNSLWSKVDQLKDTVVRVEIERSPILPRIEKIGREKRLKENKLKPTEPKVRPELQPEEIVLESSELEDSQEKIEVIDYAQEAMFRYQDIVRQKIEEKRNYPRWARKQEIEGEVHLRFIILSDGKVDKIETARSSGYKILDRAAVRTIIEANPFLPLPDEINAPYVQIEVTLVYSLR